MDGCHNEDSRYRGPLRVIVRKAADRFYGDWSDVPFSKDAQDIHAECCGIVDFVIVFRCHGDGFHRDRAQIWTANSLIFIDEAIFQEAALVITRMA